MNTQRKLLIDRSSFWNKALTFLIFSFVCYSVWALKIVDEKHISSRRYIQFQLDETLLFSLLMIVGLLGFGTFQYFLQRNEIGKRIVAERNARHLAYRDSLTGLANRRSIEEQFESFLEAARFSEFGGVLLVLDFDRFKEINDIHGHDVGDEFLKIAASRMANVVQDFGVVGRLGGDEFAIILVNGAWRETVYEVARALVERVSEPVQIRGIDFKPEVSAGMANIPGHGVLSDDLFRKADIALYQAKLEQGSYLLPFTPSMESDFLRRQSLKEDLRHALASNELSLVYQPIMGLTSGNIVTYEALLRWHHPRHGAVSPAEFVPLAEESGLITSIGEWVLQQACRDASLWSEAISVSVNVSPRQFRDHDLHCKVKAAIEAANLSPRRLVLEITESLPLKENGANLETLHEIRELGVAIALDDFGKGYSSLSYLHCFPFDKVKVDQAFVREIGKSKRSEKILQAVTTLMKSLDISVTVEGVETQEQFDWISRLQCDEVQGYFLGRPERLKSADKASLNDRLAR